MSFFGNDDYFSRVGAGQIPGHSIVDKFGLNSDLDTAGSEDIWSVGGQYSGFVTTAGTVTLSSGSASDTNSAGVGARKVEIFGVDANWDEQSEVVNLNGTTNVTSAGTYFRIYRMKVTDAGASLTNVGLITATIGGSTVAEIPVLFGQTQMCIYTVPRNYTLLVYDIQAGVDDGQPATVDFMILDNLDSNRVLRVVERHFNVAGQQQFRHKPPKVAQGPCDVFVRALAGSNNTQVTAQFYGVQRPT